MGQSQPKTTTVNPILIQQITKARDFRALADQINRYREEASSSMGDIERMSGTPADIGARRASVFERSAADYLGSIPHADKYIRATTGVDDPYAASRASAQSYLDLSKGLSEEAEREAAEYQAPEYSPEDFSWAKLPTPGSKPKSKRKAGQRLS